jgi:4-hydroxy-2-oxoheptanedioate aldolase
MFLGEHLSSLTGNVSSQAEVVLATQLSGCANLKSVDESGQEGLMKSGRSLHERLSTQRALIGLLQTHPNTALAEMGGMCGYDFLVLDGEHGLFSEVDYFQTLQALAAADILAMVRLRKHDEQALGRYLDMGANAIVVPNVSTAEEARTMVRAMVYPPGGTRGFGAPLHRATRYGMDLLAHLRAPREDVCLVVIIESVRGLANVEDILAVEGVDGVIIGPSDLTADLGCAGDFSQPAYVQAVARIEQAVAARGKILGTVPHPGFPLEALLERGHRLLILGADMSLIREAMTSQVARAKRLVDQIQVLCETGRK